MKSNLVYNHKTQIPLHVTKLKATNRKSGDGLWAVHYSLVALLVFKSMTQSYLYTILIHSV